jgi:hypothetical protein
MIWVRFGFMTGVKVTDNDREYQLGSNGGPSEARCCGGATRLKPCPDERRDDGSTVLKVTKACAEKPRKRKFYVRHFYGTAEAVPGREARHEFLVRSVRAAVDRKKRIPCCAAG